MNRNQAEAAHGLPAATDPRPCGTFMHAEIPAPDPEQPPAPAPSPGIPDPAPEPPLPTPERPPLTEPEPPPPPIGDPVGAPPVPQAFMRRWRAKASRAVSRRHAQSPFANAR
jgi:hypothetical protein